MESVLFPKYFTDRNEPAQLGWVLMALSVGGLVGALGYAVLSKYSRRRTVMLIAVLTLGVAMTIIAFLPPLPLILVLCAVVGFVYGPIAPIYNYVMQTRAPQHLRGRVVGVMGSLAYAAGPLGLVAGRARWPTPPACTRRSWRCRCRCCCWASSRCFCLRCAIWTAIPIRHEQRRRDGQSRPLSRRLAGYPCDANHKSNIEVRSCTSKFSIRLPIPSRGVRWSRRCPCCCSSSCSACLRVTAWVASLISLAVAIVDRGAGLRHADRPDAAGRHRGRRLRLLPDPLDRHQRDLGVPETVETGHFDVLRRSFSRVSDDQRIQAVIIAFSFGALLEALAGFGTPVAVTSVMLMALGFKPMKAAVLALVANTAPVAFGAMATPIITLGKVTELPVDTLGAMVGRQTPILAVFVPLSWSRSSTAGAASARRGSPPWSAASCSASRSTRRPTSSRCRWPTWWPSLLSAAAVVALVRVWQPRRAVHRARGRRGRRGGRADARVRRAGRRIPTRRADVVRAYAPVRDHHRRLRRLPDRRREEAARQGDDQVPLARASTSSAPTESR